MVREAALLAPGRAGTPRAPRLRGRGEGCSLGGRCEPAHAAAAARPRSPPPGVPGPSRRGESG
eukprot:6736663-Alexandrium_andersonii.AAC.1